MADPVFHAMDRRLSDAGKAFLATIPALSVYAKRGRDENTKVQEDGSPVAPILIAVAEDLGRAARGLPIRNMRLGLVLRANAKAGGDKETVAQILGLEPRYEVREPCAVLHGEQGFLPVRLGVGQPLLDGRLFCGELLLFVVGHGERKKLRRCRHAGTRCR